MHPFRDQARLQQEQRLGRMGGPGAFTPAVTNPGGIPDRAAPPLAGSGPGQTRPVMRQSFAEGGEASEATSPKRLDRAPRGKSNAAAPVVNIIIQDKPEQPVPPPMSPAPVPMAGPPPGGPPPGPPPGMPPGPPPGVLPPGSPPAPGAINPAMRMAPMPRAAGGSIPTMTAGALSGAGRLQKTKAAHRGKSGA